MPRGAPWPIASVEAQLTSLFDRCHLGAPPAPQTSSDLLAWLHGVNSHAGLDRADAATADIDRVVELVLGVVKGTAAAVPAAASGSGGAVAVFVGAACKC